MSRRPPPNDHAAILKQLVKLESNKSCADCKRNKHPRWASWNLGVFVCIRCSGIHRSMGVHISRVKSVDLDTWTEEQMASIMKWGNARANKYWEAKLAPGHVPNESKIENFIRTKYDSKRWVMDGPMPDPSTLGDDDDVPLSIVQEKVKVERTASLRNGGAIAPPRAAAPPVDLFGDAAEVPVRPNTTEPASRMPPPKAAPAQVTKASDSLLGMNFFGGTQSGPPRPSSTTGAPSTGRVDLKNSILSLYASAPKPAAPAPQTTAHSDPFGAFSSAPATSPQQRSTPGALGELGDAFGSLSFASTTSPPAKALATTGFGSMGPAPTQNRQPSALSGGSFFDTKPAPPPKPASPPAKTQISSLADFGGFESTPSPAISTKSPPPATSSMSDLFDMSSPIAPAPAPAVPKASNPPPITASNYTSAAAFNLTQPKPAPTAPVQTQTTALPSGNFDAWGSSDAWATPDPSPAPSAPPPQTSTATYKAPAAAPVVSSTSGWGDVGGWDEPASAKPTVTSSTSNSGAFTVQQDEEFGGWSHASPLATNSGAKPATGTSDDLFDNVWG